METSLVESSHKVFEKTAKENLSKTFAETFHKNHLTRFIANFAENKSRKTFVEPSFDEII